MEPKIHEEGNLGRPFLSSVNFDHHLQPHIQKLESYVKDSTDFIKKVSTIDKVPQESF